MSVNYKLMKLVPFDHAGNENNKQTGEEKKEQGERRNFTGREYW